MTTFLGGTTDVEEYLDGLRTNGVLVRVVEAGTDKETSLANFAAALDFPEWFGANYDALFDCLLGMEPRPAGHGVEVVWDHTRSLRRENREVYDMLVRVLGDAADERPDLSVTIIRR